MKTRLLHVGIASALLLLASTVVACGHIDEPTEPATADNGVTATTLPSSPDGDGGATGNATPDSKSSDAGAGSNATPSAKQDAAANSPKPAPPGACVTKDSKSNDKGVGAFCDNTTPCGLGSWCVSVDGNIGLPNNGPRFCSHFCLDDEDCGAGAHCSDTQCALDACAK